MDPNATLARLRELSRQVKADLDGDGSIEDCQNVANELVELIDALDGWIVNHGFLPSDWQHSRGVRR